MCRPPGRPARGHKTPIGRRLSRLALVAVCLCAPIAAHAQTLAGAQNLYERGDLAGAEKAAKAVIASGKGGSLAATHKLLGMIHYMMGNQAAAAGDFAQALKLDPGLKVGADEVLDPAVVAFFDAQRQKVAAKPAPAVAKAPVKQTLLRINTNVPAAISIDGILVGASGAALNVEPGRQIVEIRANAKGYLAKKIGVTAVKDQETAVTVTLEKPQPKAPPPPKTVAARPAPKAAKGGDGDQPYAPTPDALDELFAAEESPQAPPPDTPAAAPYPPPAGYPPPGYMMVPQPMPSYPPPAYTPYPDPGPPPPPAGVDPYGAPNPYYTDEGPSEPPEAPKRRSRESAKPHQGSLIVAVLPFGIGQFQNGSTLLGALFAGIEGGALYYYFKTTKDAAAAETDAQTYFANKQTRGEKISETDRAYLANNEQYVSALRQKAQYALIGFGGLWIAGAVEAVLSQPGGKSRKSKGPGRGARGARPALDPYAGDLPDATARPTADTGSDAFDEDGTERLAAATLMPRIDFGLTLAPQAGVSDPALAAALALDWRW